MIHLKLDGRGSYIVERFLIAFWIFIVVMASLISPYRNQTNSITLDATREKNQFELVKTGWVLPVFTNFAGEQFSVSHEEKARE